ncbi:DUF6354 family protein [Amycolatopsis sp. NPDC049159]|uniref:DUF6354 family protein n=1 Tax=Amycolatopsis sp. NPDC049159 TaxID=3157210 RepID=UPI0033CCD82B
MTDQSAVEPGQLWVDNDPRNSRGTRFLMVTSVGETHAVCESWYEHGGGHSRTTEIRLDRFKPTATGYRRANRQECERQGVAP